jgi:hypothetical protein
LKNTANAAATSSSTNRRCVPGGSRARTDVPGPLGVTGEG